MFKRKNNDIYFGSKSKKSKVEKKDEDILSNADDLLLNLTKKHDDQKIERDNNHIYFYSEVDRESIFELIMLIKEAEEENILTSLKLRIDKVPIFLHINSKGGSVFEAFNAIDAIKACRVPVNTIIEGATASAGTLISVVGEKRYMCPSAYMLIHQLSSSYWGKMSEIEDEFKNLQELMDKIKEIYKDYTTIPKKELNDLLKHDLWLNSDKSLKYGLVDEIWQ